MPLQNYVIFASGVPERLHFSGYTYDQVTITDSVTGKPAPRNRLVMTVDEINGSNKSPAGLPVIAQLSVLAQSLAGKLEPYLANDAYKNYDFIITQTGLGYLSRYSVQVVPRSK